MKTRTLTLSALSASLATVVLILGTVFAEALDLFAVIIAPVILAMPLYIDSIKGSLLATLVAGILALLLTGFNIANLLYISYFTFFGFFPIVKYYVMTRRKSKILYYLLCCLWCVLAIIGIYYFYTAFLGLGLDLIIPISPSVMPFILAGVGVIVFFLMDAYVFATQIFMFKLLSRILKNK